MGRPPNPENTSEFREFWRRVKEYHTTAYRIRLRPAANLLGFTLYPYGWDCFEFKVVTPNDQMPYEPDWHQRSHMMEAFEGKANELGIAAAKHARKHRRDNVHEVLRLMMAKEKVVRYPLKRINPQHAEAYFDNVPNFNAPLDQIDWEKIRIEESLVGARLHTQTEITLNAESVMNAANKIYDGRGNKLKGNWFKIERKLRMNFETLGEKGTLTSLEAIALASDEEDDANHEPRRETLRKLIHALWDEYGFAK